MDTIVASRLTLNRQSRTPVLRSVRAWLAIVVTARQQFVVVQLSLAQPYVCRCGDR